jgi:hypothetical protein
LLSSCFIVDVVGSQSSFFQWILGILYLKIKPNCIILALVMLFLDAL